MKLATFQHHGTEYIGAVDGDGIHTSDCLVGVNMLDVIDDWDHFEPELAPGRGHRFDLAAVTLLAPVPRPRRNIFCVGVNYRAHAQEFLTPTADGTHPPIPTHPMVFTKPPETVTGPNSIVDIPPGVTDSLDYEGELAVVIGRGGRSITTDTGMNHVFGYTIVNDITARDIQKRHGQWFLGKSLDTSCPMGPWILTMHAAPPPDSFTIRTTVRSDNPPRPPT